MHLRREVDAMPGEVLVLVLCNPSTYSTVLTAA